MKKLTQEVFIERCIEKHRDKKYDYSQTVYGGSHSFIEYICPTHGIVRQKAYHHLQYGCKECGHVKGGQSRKTSIDDFVRKAERHHGKKYDYSAVVFSSQHDKVKIGCPSHGVFLQAANDHLKGRGCAKCGDALVAEKLSYPKLNTRDYLNRAIEVHGQRYDYSSVVYKGILKKIRIRCSEHGYFDQNPHNHLAGNGCPDCALGPNSLTWFIDQARKVHGDKYEYRSYSGMDKQVEVVCHKHGIFSQKASDHVYSKARCQSCAREERPTIKQNEWLDKMGVNAREVSLKLPQGQHIVADGFDATSNTIYEFWGDYWHGHDKYEPDQINTVTGTTFGALREKTERKRRAILSAGFKLVEIWEHDWDKINGKTS